MAPALAILSSPRRAQRTTLTAIHSFQSSPGGSLTASRRLPDPSVACMCCFSCSPCGAGGASKEADGHWPAGEVGRSARSQGVPPPLDNTRQGGNRQEHTHKHTLLAWAYVALRFGRKVLVLRSPPPRPNIAFMAEGGGALHRAPSFTGLPPCALPLSPLGAQRGSQLLRPQAFPGTTALAESF